MVLAELAGGVAHRLQDRGDGRHLRGQPDWRTCLADGRQPGADRELAGDEVGPAGGAARLGVVVGEEHALRGEPIEVRRPAGHDAAVIGADVEPADVVSHDEDDVRLLGGWLGLLGASGGCWRGQGQESSFPGNLRATGRRGVAAGRGRSRAARLIPPPAEPRGPEGTDSACQLPRGSPAAYRRPGHPSSASVRFGAYGSPDKR